MAKFLNHQGKFLDKKQYRMLLNTAFDAFSEDSNKYLKSTFSRGVIGFKTNCLAGFNSTFVPLANALTEKLIEGAGCEENDIVIWERSNRELKNAGYRLNASSFGRRCFGTDSDTVGYSPDFYSSGKASSLVTRILTNIVDHNINLPVLKDHSIAGLSAGMKNMFGAVNNPNKYHGNNCDPYTADVSNLKPIKNKQRLAIIDAYRIQYNNGPGFDNKWLDYYNGLILSDDPVAADRVALEVMEHLRSNNGLGSLDDVGRPAKYIATGQQVGLGLAELDKIDLRVVTIDEQGNESAASRRLF